jgi:hypothetical protein
MIERLKSPRLVAGLVLAACTKKEPDMNAKSDIPIACVLSALTPEQRAREATLLKEHFASVKEVRESANGYSFRYAPDVGLFARIAELVGLEHRCCPFLDLELEWSRGDSAPWLHVTGGAGAKQFVASSLTTVRPSP